MFAQNLKYLRKKFDMDQETLATKLGRKSTSTISEWESGKYTPKAGILSDIAEIFNISLEDLMSTNLSEGKANITTIYNQLTPARQQNVYTYADNQLKEQQDGKVVSMPVRDDKIELKANGVLSAGVGEFLDDSTETFPVMVSKPIPDSFDYVFKVNGHSMEPTFEDGQVIFVTEHEEYRNGQIIAVVVDGCAYVKRLKYTDDSMTLVSLNPAYPNVQVLEDDEYRILGVAFA